MKRVETGEKRLPRQDSGECSTSPLADYISREQRRADIYIYIRRKPSGGRFLPGGRIRRTFAAVYRFCCCCCCGRKQQCLRSENKNKKCLPRNLYAQAIPRQSGNANLPPHTDGPDRLAKRQHLVPQNLQPLGGFPELLANLGRSLKEILLCCFRRSSSGVRTNEKKTSYCTPGKVFCTGVDYYHSGLVEVHLSPERGVHTLNRFSHHQGGTDEWEGAFGGFCARGRTKDKLQNKTKLHDTNYRSQNFPGGGER